MIQLQSTQRTSQLALNHAGNSGSPKQQLNGLATAAPAAGA